MYLDAINQRHCYQMLYNIVRNILKYRGGFGGSLGGLRNASTVSMSRTIQTYQLLDTLVHIRTELYI